MGSYLLREEAHLIFQENETKHQSEAWEQTHILHHEHPDILEETEVVHQFRNLRRQILMALASRLSFH